VISIPQFRPVACINFGGQ